MNHKERVLKALAGESVDRLPVQIEVSIGYSPQLAEHWGIDVHEMDEYFGNDFIYTYSLAGPEWFRFDEALLQRAEDYGLIRIDEEANLIYDQFGVAHDRTAELPWFHVHPLEESSEVKHYQFPDPTAEGITDQAKEAIFRYGDEYAILFGQHLGLFERCWMLRGFNNFMMDLASDPTLADYLLDAVTDYQIEVARRFVDVGITCAQFGDDYGTQKRLAMSPKTWRRFFKPRLARIYQVYKDAGVVLMQHSCGCVTQILDDLVEIGLEVLHPVQSRAMDIHELSNKWGKDLGFFGGIDTQELLPYGSPADIDDAVREAVDVLGRYGKYVIAPSQHILSDTSIENIEALASAAFKYGMRDGPAT